MQEKTVAIATPDGSMETFITHPQQGGPFPAVIFYMDIWGVREELFDLARRLAVVGYYCMVPDFYYRQGRIRNEVRDARGRMVSIATLPEAQRAAIRAPGTLLTDAMVIADTRAIFDFLGTEDAASARPMGCIGYCMGGRHAVRAMAAFPGRMRAGAALHGSNLVTDQDDSPHLGMASMRGELYCGYAGNDPYAAPAIREAMQSAAQGPGVRYLEQVHPGAEHGYAMPDRDIHDRAAFYRDWELILAMFRRQMPPGG